MEERRGTKRTYSKMSGRRGQVRRRVRARVRARAGTTRLAGYYGRYPPVGSENKFKDFDTAVTPVATTGDIVLNSICTIAQGTNESERIGRKATITKVLWRYSVKLATTATIADSSDIVRVILYVDKQCNGAAAAVTDILDAAQFDSFLKLENSGRFRILMDKFHTVSAQAGIAGNIGEVIVFRTKFCDVNLPIEYSSTTGAIAEIRSNNIGILAISKSAHCVFDGKLRIRYSDT